MTDQELLEKAASAAGIEGLWGDVSGFGECSVDCSDMFFVDGAPWNPLGDDGDALRLAVKLGFGISVPLSNERTDVVTFGRTLLNAIEAHNGNPYAATRRAIVRAAAALADAGGRDADD